MLDVFSWRTGNGRKIHIMLEETGIDYRLHPINIHKGEQFTPEFLALNPNNKIPVIVDDDGPGGDPLTLFESGAILLYLAEKTGQLLPTDPVGRLKVIQWLMFQVGGVGPMLGQAHYFRGYTAEPVPHGIERYTNEAGRLYRVIDKQLGDHEYLAGDYSIADIATFPWLQGHEKQGQDLADYPNIRRWFDAIMARQAVQRGIKLLRDDPGEAEVPHDDKWRDIMFGAIQYQPR